MHVYNKGPIKYMLLVAPCPNLLPKCLMVYNAKTLISICSRDLFVSFAQQDFQEQLKAISFKDVVIRGRELTGALVTALINVYIKDNASVDAISSLLRDICPLLYSSDDSVCSKVFFPLVCPWVCEKSQLCVL